MRLGNCASLMKKMKQRYKALSWSRVAILAWASLWMLAAPLFHVHPEADHRHGEVGHVHGGTVHTVWSPDLDCEFDRHRQVDRAEGSSQSGTGTLVQFSHPGDSHVEFSLSLLNESTDRKSLKPFVAQAFGFVSAAASDMERSVRIDRKTSLAQLSEPILYTRSPRAPPARFI